MPLLFTVCANYANNKPVKIKIKATKNIIKVTKNCQKNFHFKNVSIPGRLSLNHETI